MKNTNYCLSLFIALLISNISGATAQTSDRFTLPTPWAEKALLQEVPLPEYPRPQMVRSEWMNLNGLWDYIGGKDLTSPQNVDTPLNFPVNFEKIRVPFPPESELSGIARNGDTNLWYRRNFTVPKAWKEKRVLLHFGAVDRIATIFINGKKAGQHIGGYDAFNFDITDYLKSGENTLIVGSYDPNDGKAACGKNGPKGDYTYTSGIWQTVWLEPVEKEHIAQIKLIPNLEKSQLEIIAFSGQSKLKVTAIVKNGQTEISKKEGTTNEEFYLPIENPHLWNPEDPFLYDLTLELKDNKGNVLDKIDSYFGMRSVSIGKVNGINRTLLNGKFEFQIGLLDQGYWPDGIFTAPTDEALLYDIELAKKTGFNVIRKHIKVEPQRWYYHCDRLGLLVWQDMPNLWHPDDTDSIAVRTQFRAELKTMIDQHISSPSIIMWVPFNENWGAFEATDITAWVKQYDPSRLVNGISGYNYAPGYRPAYGDPGNGDFVDLHHYGKIEDKALPRPDENRAASLGEFGGKGLFVRDHLWPVPNNAYEMMINKETLTDTYVLMMNEIEQRMKYRGLSAAIYTQTSDVEHEINGLVTYDRKVEKMNFEKVKYINEEIIKSSKEIKD
ncbi:beta-glycosidase [Dysgonomonas sp. Marseille-P4677]|uniref:glycoside hydrolase family 2 protein n=1 Tax=Dysgonomonas sp. Marseille-P4677 TaxID=2364790 RepID=UPI001914B4E7|nr:sugar-binding domain-containing protein [Dysgonomonas sp. Marseille-P4677]MBK5721195.1 beta-glycosidase [Dysgonomonas sp. Marseille-P4677]